MTAHIATLADFVATHGPVLVITGAGCSTGSGIGDYRDADGRWKHAEPVLAQDFVREPAARQRYWARSMRGWPAFARARPNPAHAALRQLERGDALAGLITQNVDGLHHLAGQRRVIELHGNLRWVVCMGCGQRVARAHLQEWLVRENPQVLGRAAVAAPDGDAHLNPAAYGNVRVPMCRSCGGVLKPDVVFFGESVPAARVAQAHDWVAQANAVLVVGSSLMVYSSFRFVRRAHELALPMAVLNRGKTRADGWWQHKIEADCVEVLPAVAARLRDGQR